MDCMALKRLIPVLILSLLLSAAAQTSPVYPSRIPPELQPADAASRSLLQQARTSLSLLKTPVDVRPAYPLSYIQRKAVFEMAPDQSCEVKLNDLIYVMRSHRSLTVPGSRQFSKVRVILPDGHDRSQQRFGMYRWHLADPIRFQRDIRVTIQALGWRSGGRYLPLQDDIASTAFLYLSKPVATRLPLPGPDALEVV